MTDTKVSSSHVTTCGLFGARKEEKLEKEQGRQVSNTCKVSGVIGCVIWKYDLDWDGGLKRTFVKGNGRDRTWTGEEPDLRVLLICR